MDNLNQKWINITFIGVVLLIVIGGYYYTRYEIRKTDQAAEERGQHKGYALGKFAREPMDADDRRLALEIALKGSSIILADEFLSKQVGYQKSINELLNKQNKSQPLIKSVVESFTGDVNYAVLESVTNHADFSVAERNKILSKFEKNRKVVGQEAYDKYIEHLSKVKNKNRTFERVKALVNSTKELSCTYLTVLTPVQRTLIATRLLKAGGLPKNKFGNATVGFVADQLCHIIVYNLVSSLAGAMMDYATILNFTEEELIGKHQLESVLKMVTAQSKQNFVRRITYERPLVDPIFTIGVEATVLAGIDLHKHYSIEIYPREITSTHITEIVVTIPKPEIISVNTTIRTDSENKFFSTGLKDHEQNDMIATTKEYARSQALRNGILENARDGAEDALRVMYAPFLFNSGSEYDIIIKFSDKKRGKKNYMLKG